MNSDNRKESFKLLGVSGSDSESEIPEFTIPRRKVKIKKKFRATSGNSRSNNLRHVRGCSAVFVFKILGILILASGLGITVWLAVTLHIKVDELRKQYLQVEEGSKGTPSKFHDIHSQLNELQKNHTALRDDVYQLNTTLEAMKQEITTLKKTTANLQKSVEEAPQLKTLPQQIDSLSKSLALIGSKIRDLEQDTDQMKSLAEGSDKEKQKLQEEFQTLQKKVEALVTVQSKPDDTATTMTYTDEIKRLEEITAENNISVWNKLQWVVADLHEHHNKITTVTHLVDDLESQVKKLQSSNVPSDAVVTEVLESVQGQLTALVNETVASAVNRSLGNNVLPTLDLSNGTVALSDLVQYVENLTQLYTALRFVAVTIPAGQQAKLASNTSLNVTNLLFDSLDRHILNLTKEDKAQIQAVLSAIKNLETTNEVLKNDSSLLRARMDALQAIISKIQMALPQVFANHTLPSGLVSQPTAPLKNLSRNSSSLSTDTPLTEKPIVVANEPSGPSVTPEPSEPKPANVGTVNSTSAISGLNGTTPTGGPTSTSHIPKPNHTGESLGQPERHPDEPPTH